MKSIQINIIPCELKVPREIVEVYVDSILYAVRMVDSSVPSAATSWIREIAELIEIDYKAEQYYAYCMADL